jgi:hypothetical protein
MVTKVTGNARTSTPASLWIPNEHFAPLTAWSDTFYDAHATTYNVGNYD